MSSDLAATLEQQAGAWVSPADVVARGRIEARACGRVRGLLLPQRAVRRAGLLLRGLP